MNYEDHLEAMIDKVGLNNVLDHLVNVCYYKAEHLRTNWQDENMAKSWERDGKRLDVLVSQLENTGG